jgi:aryl-alcohol dehydrogenase-like predicted oxidoreductase
VRIHAGKVMNSKGNAAGAAGTLHIGDLVVNRMGFGAMRICGPSVWGPPADAACARKVLRRTLELGVNFIDTADSYGPEVSETLIAEALHPYPADLVIATKGGLVRPQPHAWDPDGRPEHLRRALEGSLKRLRRDCIDLYQLHAPDPAVPYAESVGALADLQRAGKIRHLGISNVTLAQLEAARRIAPIASVQNKYNLGERSSQDVLRACERLGIAFIPWYPLDAGRSLKSSALKSLAAARGVGAAQLALAWLMSLSPVILMIPGTGSLAHLEENVAAAGLVLTNAERAALG